ncbi:Cytochrome P450 4V2 [Paramuricea clavata]|uniref:Cytochrome P450 4V2 n=1 Tax=Paramuricea clavata TaxID=317549 RepID=A0A6S7GGJ4_PARCT|nr:Cytochrome P450 4V2 [Paramuricea clavata]
MYQRQSSILIQLLEEKAGKGEFDIASYLRMFTLDIICEAAMGVNVNAQFDSNSEYVSTVLSISELILERWRCPWLWRDSMYNLTTAGRKQKNMLRILHGFSSKVISDRIEQRQLDESRNTNTSAGGMSEPDSSRKRQAFLDLLLDEYDKGNISKEGVREEVDTFMFEVRENISAK